MAVWTKNGLISTDFRSATALVIPTVARICTLGTTTPIQLYADPTTATPIASDPIATGQPIGSPGIDVSGQLFAYAPPGYYTPVLGGISYPPLEVKPHLDDLAALAGGISGSGQTLQLKTASTRTITNQAAIASGVTLADWGIVLNPGDTYGFDGVAYVNATRAAGVKLLCQATGTGAQLALVMRGPNFGDTGSGTGAGNQFDVTLQRDTAITITTNGAQQFGGFAPPRTVADAVRNSTTTITSATAAFNAQFDTGAAVSGTGIPAGATIASVTNATTAVLSAPATSSGSGGSLTITPSTDSYIEILGGVVSLPASAPAPGALTWKFAQGAQQTPDVTTFKDIISCLYTVKLT